MTARGTPASALPAIAAPPRHVGLDHICPKGSDIIQHSSEVPSAQRAAYGAGLLPHARREPHGLAASQVRAADTGLLRACLGLRALSSCAPEARREFATLATKPDMQAAAVEIILREALLVLG
ncbi:MAG: hypothetical protein BGO98_49750 [Myxococcales bacterium 68-20]|nr:MAG: hypothetical protein BGO98_49750 [Myxococcales bacterium 68-20]